MATNRSNTQVLKSPNEPIDGPAPLKRNARQGMSICKVCDTAVTLQFQGEKSLSAVCRSCNDKYHANCIGLSSAFVFKLVRSSKKGWLCYSCSHGTFKFMHKLDERLSNVEQQVKRYSNETQIDSSLQRAPKETSNKILLNPDKSLKQLVEEFSNFNQTN